MHALSELMCRPATAPANVVAADWSSHQRYRPARHSDGLVDTFGGLTNLRPRRLQGLLQACTSVRTKRAFLLLARYFRHGWFSRLDISAIDLGRGKRQLLKGGVLDREYQITVPPRFANAD